MIGNMVAETTGKWLSMEMPVAGVTALAIGIRLMYKKGAAIFSARGFQGNYLPIWLSGGSRNNLKAEVLNRELTGILGVKKYVY